MWKFQIETEPGNKEKAGYDRSLGASLIEEFQVIVNATDVISMTLHFPPFTRKL
jgi:hypothetical protein